MAKVDLTHRPASREELETWYSAALAEQESSGLSVADFAEELGVTATTLYQWRRRLSATSAEDRRRQPSPKGLVEVTVDSWESELSQAWRRKKMRRDTQRQMIEIERHKYFLSEKYGRDVGWEAAAADWVTKHARTWREWWETQPEACP